MPKELNQDVLQRLARLGAEARLAQIDMERRAILAAFPDLARGGRPARRGRPPASQAEAPSAPAKVRRRRGGMSAAARKAASERMKKYWADRRKAKG